MTEAPRVGADGKAVAVRLYLPGVTWAADHEMVGVWDARQEAWIDHATGAKVYPSQWLPLAALP